MNQIFWVLLLLPSIVVAASTPEWLNAQWKLLPRAEWATQPSLTIPISQEDRAGLDLGRPHPARNAYLNATYKRLAQDFARCLNVPMASWYHFGYWASTTSGRFISGERFRTMNPIQRSGLAVLAGLGLAHSEEDMITLFGRVNFLVGVEMIPAGKLFLQTYCSGGTLRPYDDFGKNLVVGDRARRELHDAFEQYYLALKETDPRLKVERVAYGTTLQMMGEQRRAQVNVDALFAFGDQRHGPIEFIYRWMAAGSAGLELGHGLVIPFVKDVSAKFMSPDLDPVTLPGYKALHQEHRVSLEPMFDRFLGTAVQDWGNLDQRLRYLVAIMRGHGSRAEVLEAGE